MPNGKISYNLSKVANLSLAIEPFWVLFATSLVYAAILLNWASFLPWLGITFAFAPFLIRYLKYGYISKRTTFDIPLVLLLGSIILGTVVSEDVWLSIGALQSFLALTAFYYFLVNYQSPALIFKIALPAIAAGLLIVLILLSISDTILREPIHGLHLGILIFISILLGIGIFSQRIGLRAAIGIISSFFIALVLLFTEITGSVQRLFALDSLIGRMEVRWLNTLYLMAGSSSEYLGLGLGCWPLRFYEYMHQDMPDFGLHVHNIYLEVFANLGLFGLVAFLALLAAMAKVSADILYSNKKHPYYGLGVGVVLACIITLVVGFLESAPFCIPFMIKGVYYYLLSPVLWLLMGALIMVRSLLKETTSAELPNVQNLAMSIQSDLNQQEC